MKPEVKTKAQAQNENSLVNDGDKAWVTLSQVINLGNYENLRIEVGYSKTIKQGDNPIELVRAIEEDLEDLLIEKVEQICGKDEKPKRTRKR